MQRAMLLFLVATLAACVGTGWRAQQIDGATATTFERSVALLHNTLPPRRREDFNIALGVILMRTAYRAADLDQDGAVNDLDARRLSDAATALWIEIGRGNLVGAIEQQGADIAAEYFKQLDSLTYDDVLELGGGADDAYLAEIRRQLSAAGCAERQGRTLGRINDGCD